MGVVAAAKRIESWPVERLVPYEGNARTHSTEQVAQLAASITEFGFVNPILVDEKGGVVIAGHGRLAAAKDLGMAEVPVVVLDHLTPVQRRAYVLADNQLAQNAGWDMKLLQREVAALDLQDFDLDLVGFDDDFLGEIRDVLGDGYDPDDPTRPEGEAHGGGDGDEDPDDAVEQSGEVSDGSLLALVDIAIDEPKHQVTTGDVWNVGPHMLLCCSVVEGWPIWLKYLNSDKVLFCPYPGPFVPLGTKAVDHVLIMVQPDPYVAGHILDHYAKVNGPKAVKKGGQQ